MFGVGQGGQIFPPNPNRQFALQKCELGRFDRARFDLLCDFRVIYDMAKVCVCSACCSLVLMPRCLTAAPARRQHSGSASAVCGQRDGERVQCARLRAGPRVGSALFHRHKWHRAA